MIPQLKKSKLQLSMLLSCMIAGDLFATEVVVPSQAVRNATPVSAEACAGLEINAERLSCYDVLFRQPATLAIVDPVNAVKESRITAIATSHDEADSAKKTTVLSNLFTADATGITPNTSLLDRRWELSPQSKLGVWNIRAYQPVYLLPTFWTSKKNEEPQSANPDNVVSPEEARSLDSTEAKFQLSLKTKAIENLFGDNGDVWLGYTQSSYWQVYNADDSRPFRQTNYEPEASLVFRTNYNVLGLEGRMLGLTFNHQSNGREDPWSRSWNRIILSLGFEKDNFALMVRPWYRIKEEASQDNNPDILNYIGRGDMLAFYRWNDQDFSLMLRHTLRGGEDNRGAIKFDWTFPISGRLRGQLQLFDGYGESLIDYNHRATYVGLGVSLMNWF